jgi:hypothetical protein
VLRADGSIPESQLVVRQRGKDLKLLNNLDKNIEPMVYPIYHPTGNELSNYKFFLGSRGWSEDLRNNSNKKITRLEWTRYKIATRLKGKFNPIIFGEKLFQQYLVDAYIRVERDRINWIKVNL